MTRKKVLITGADGFIGKNLQLCLAERKDIDVSCFTRGDDVGQLRNLVEEVDFVFHLAGVNRPQDSNEFTVGNANLTRGLSQALGDVAEKTGKRVPIVYTSSIQAKNNNLYGLSKREAEEVLQDVARSHNIPVHIFRLPNVFGKWARPNYNSAVATFCYNSTRGLPIQIRDPAAPMVLVYVDDVIEHFVQLMDGAAAEVDAEGFATVANQYATTVGEVAQRIESFKDGRSTLLTDRVGTGLTRALYSTYVSYLPPESFSYSVPQHGDSRGVFVERC